MEITSFNQIWVEAARAGLLLQTFHQLPSGRFVAVWRRGSGPGAAHYAAAEHERSFDALLTALGYAIADGYDVVAIIGPRPEQMKSCRPEDERNCDEPWRLDDNVPCCVTCGVYRQSKVESAVDSSLTDDGLFA